MKRLFLFAFVALLALAPPAAHAALTPPEHPLFEGDAVHEISLTFHQPDWWDQLEYNFETYDDPPYIAAEFDWETVHFDSIGVRFKGSSSYMANNTYKKSFKLDIDAYESGADVFGLDKLNLNCGFLDASFVREAAVYELCEAAGLPTERFTFAAVYINGTYWGLYTLVEQTDQEFIDSRFGPGEQGNLWKGDDHGSLEYFGTDPASYYGDYELKTNEEENDWTDLIDFTYALNNTSLADLPDTMSEYLDVNSALALLAVDNLTVNLDSYCGRCSNYYAYHRQVDDRFVFLNWDLNESFGIFDFWNMSTTQKQQLSPHWTSPTSGEERPLAERLWAVGAFDDVYVGHLQRLMAGAADPDVLVDRMEELRDLIRPYVYMETSGHRLFTTSQFEAAMTTDIIYSSGPPPGRLIPALETFVRNRHSYLTGLLGSYTRTEGLVLNELMASNDATIADGHGEFDDWVEIANIGTAPVNLSGFYLTDDMAYPTLYALPDTILAAGDYLVLWIDDTPAQGPLHAGFKLDVDGEDLFLMDGSVIHDWLTFPELAADVSYGRWPDGSGDWGLLSLATPGAENENPIEPEEITLYINEFMALNDSGIQDPTGAYEDWLEIFNPGPEDIEMYGLFLTDDLTNTMQWSFPDVTLEVGGFLLVWCDSDTEDGPLHTNFKLSGDGEDIGLFGRLAAGNEVIDSYTFGAQTTDVSEGRETDGGATWTFFTEPTPGESNSGTSVSDDPAITRFSLAANSPNPFSPSTSVSFTAPTRSHVTVGVYSVSGRRIAVLADMEFDAGPHSVTWNGLDSDGQEVASGIYFVRMQTDEFEASGKMTLLR